MPLYTYLVMEYRQFFSNRLKEARAKRGYTQAQLAKLCGLHVNAIAKYEGREIIPTAQTLKKLAEALDVSGDYFLFDQALMEGVPKVKNPALYEKYLVLESLDKEDQNSAFNVLDALIERHRVREITNQPVNLPNNKPQNGKKQSKHAAT
jgi:transcriptional regulator with XRE-family HTH domain